MDKRLLLASENLEKILKEDISFKEISKQISANKDIKNIAGDVNALIGCELRHHLFLTHLLKGVELGDKKYLLLIALANHFFLKKIDDKEVTSFLKEINNEKILDYFKESNALDIVSKDFSNDSIEMASIRFNVPTYLIKMWFKHFGKTLTYKTLKANVRTSESYYSVNQMKMAKEDFEKKYLENFLPTEVDNSYLAKNKKQVHSYECYLNREIYNISLALKDILNKVDYSHVEEMTLYTGHDDSVIRDLFCRSGGKIGLHIALPDLEVRPEVLRIIRLENVKNINYFEIKDYDALPAHISNKQDLVVVFPTSSSFDKINKFPDYLLHFKQESFDELIKGEKEALERMSSLVIEGGKLLYIVDTLNRKESLSVLNSFLANHDEFNLIESNQIFPFTKLKGTYYYALLERKEND